MSKTRKSLVTTKGKDASCRAKPLVAGAGYMGGWKPYQNGGKVNKIKLWNNVNTSSKDTVFIKNIDSVSKVTAEMITAANAKGWNVYIGGTLK